MTTRAAQLRFARSSYAVAWREFVRLFSTEPGLLCCFFEGEDLKYYGVRIELLSQSSRYRAFSVGGREGVIQLLDLALTADDGRHANRPVAFFVDRDFVEPNVSDARLYVTPGYSIENFYVTPGAFERILAAEFGIHPGDGNHAAAIALYRQSFDSFNAATRLLNAWLRQQRLIERSQRSIGQACSVLNLRDTQVSEFATLSVSGCCAKYTIASLNIRFGRATSAEDEAAIQAWASDARSVPESAHRGKFLMQFLCKFLVWLAEDLNRATPKLVPERRNVSLTIQPGNALSQLSQYAETSPCLRAYLDRLCVALGSRAAPPP